MTALPEPERDALVLHVWEGLSYDDVADALGVPVGTVDRGCTAPGGRLRELAAASGGEQGERHRPPRPGRIVS